MATKLRKLVLKEVSLVDRGANPHAQITLYKRHVEPEDDETTESPLFKRASPLLDDKTRGSAPKDYGKDFKAGGVGPATDALWISFDNYRRAMPGQSSKAFAIAWSELDDAGKQAIRNEEAAVEAARRAQAAAVQTERRQQMSDEGVMVKAAHAIASGTLDNTVRRSTWHAELRKMAAERQEQGESIERAVARLVKTDPDALALFRASVGGLADDVPPAPAAPVLKHGTAYTSLRAIAAELQKADPKLTQYSAFAKAYASNPELAARSKVEQAFV